MHLQHPRKPDTAALAPPRNMAPYHAVVLREASRQGGGFTWRLFRSGRLLQQAFAGVVVVVLHPVFVAHHLTIQLVHQFVDRCV